MLDGTNELLCEIITLRYKVQFVPWELSGDIFSSGGCNDNSIWQ